MTPFAIGEIYDLCLNVSREYVFEICTSTTGVEIAFTVSAIPMDVWV
jgi:hypothetical protein